VVAKLHVHYVDGRTEDFELSHSPSVYYSRGELLVSSTGLRLSLRGVSSFTLGGWCAQVQD
jgi:hypothetical protein